jgi:hypothetical protein
MSYIDGVDFEDIDSIGYIEDEYDYGFIDDDPDFHRGLDIDIETGAREFDLDFDAILENKYMINCID